MHLYLCFDCGQTFTNGEGAHLCPDGEEISTEALQKIACDKIERMRGD